MELNYILQSQQEEKQEKEEKQEHQTQQTQPTEPTELTKLTKLTEVSSTNAIPSGLYYALMTNSASLAIMLNHFTNNWSLYLMLTWMPSYMDKMLHYNLSQSGILFLPYLMMAIFCWCGGYYADYLIIKKSWSKRSVRIVIN